MLKQLLYKAVDKNGNKVSNYIKARTTAEALAVLEYKGFTHIVFLNDTVTAISDPEGLHEVHANARFEIENFKSPGFLSFIKEVLRQNRSFIIFGFGVSLIFWWANNLTFTIVGVLIVVSMPLISLWSYRAVSRYNKFLEAYAYGEAEKVYRLAKSLEKFMTAPEMQFDLDVRCATMRAKNGELDSACADIKKWEFDHTVGVNGIYESRVSYIYLASGNVSKFLSLMHEAKDKNTDNNQTILLDLALAEALYGDIETAETLLNTIVRAEVIEIGVAYIDWLEGLIAFSKNDQISAERKLIDANKKLFEYANNPAAWTAIAVCLVDLALLAIHENQKSFAKQAVMKFWKIIQVHGDPEKTKKLRTLYSLE